MGSFLGFHSNSPLYIIKTTVGIFSCFKTIIPCQYRMSCLNILLSLYDLCSSMMPTKSLAFFFWSFSCTVKARSAVPLSSSVTKDSEISCRVLKSTVLINSERGVLVFAAKRSKAAVRSGL